MCKYILFLKFQFSKISIIKTLFFVFQFTRLDLDFIEASGSVLINRIFRLSNESDCKY